MTDMLLRVLTPEDHAAGIAFYETQDYRGGIGADHRPLAAFRGDRIVGLVRLCEEEGIQLLRGMFIDASEQRQGLGTRMLEALEPHMGDRDCWLVCPERLFGFYGQAGFAGVPLEDAPAFLAARARHYQMEARGTMAVMRRAGQSPD